ncbi:MAG: heavy metal translocating P-type ATPase, partial [Helicobacter sp.]|nr:heavy metal translocating P-type ATPase [Helicobacter sp.]
FLYSLTLFGSTHLYFESIAVILCLVLLGKSIEERAKEDAQSGLSALLSEQPKEAICLRNGIEEKIATDDIVAGNLLRILPGSRIPVDGIVFEGIANVDESMLTGEVLPVGKKQGERLYAGSLNTNTGFVMQASGTSAQSSLQAIVALIEQAALSKTKLTQIADKIAAIFVPTIIIIAVVAGAVWTFLSDFATGFEIAVSVLVVSCPCALGLATPMSVLIGGSLASARALFFKSAQTMEDTRTIDSVLFDKTGTLTNKTLEIVRIVPMSCSEDELLALMASIEQTSEHLIAQAIVRAAKERGLAIANVATSHSEAGFGITARIDERDYRLGNAAFVGATDEATKDDAAGIVVYLAREGEILGKIVLFDNLKEGATELVGWLKAQHIDVQILSGDSEHYVRKIAQQLGDVAYTAAAKPADKLRVVQSLKEQGRHVMMVGDG